MQIYIIIIYYIYNYIIYLYLSVFLCLDCMDVLRNLLVLIVT